MYISGIEKKFNKMFLPFYIIAFELDLSNSEYYKGNTCHRQSMFQQRVIKVQRSNTREVFSVGLPQIYNIIS